MSTAAAPSSPSFAPDDFAWLTRVVHERSAIRIEESKAYLVATRLASIATEGGHADVAALIAHLRRQPQERIIEAVVDALTTNETSWLRDSHPFHALLEVVIPEIRDRLGGSRPTRIWSAACSTGQEPYGLAILLRDKFGPLTNGFEIHASDLSERVLAKARAGEFSQVEVNRGLPARLLVEYFDQRATRWLISDEIRRQIKFRRLNLAQPFPPMPAVDVVLLRNVLIYFDNPTKQAILERVAKVLAPQGYLLLGSTEMVVDPERRWQPQSVGASTVYRLAEQNPKQHTEHRRLR
ncbi:MAG: protein-glutamate O-methyltransferase CheR [Acidimicrobiales bacterium]|nr:protein-glutamate O-methyltransferase CheR [Acidimicrobiales bacterium]